jgi:ribosomal protein S18 acetylase RimI-like enzyme
MKFYPAEAEVPAGLTTGEVVLRPLSPADAEADYEALMSSKEMLRAWDQSDWPADDFTLEENRSDLERHEAEHKARSAFTYTVVDPGDGRCVGCVYIYPLEASLRTMGANTDALSGVGHFEACVTFWVRESELAGGLEGRLLGDLVAWLDRDWAFRRVAFGSNSGDPRQMALLREAGFEPGWELPVDGRVARYVVLTREAPEKRQSVVLRSARRDLDEGRVFARFADDAAEGFFRLMLGRGASEIIARAYLQSGHTLSYEHVTFAERDGTIVGMVSAYTGEQHSGFSEEPLRQAAGKSARRMRVVRTLCAPLWRILESIPDGDFYLQSIAVDPEARGAGIGSALMDHVEECARAAGSRRLSLDVSAKNEGARRLYARLGMTEASSWPASRFVPTIFVRMAKPL